MQKVDFWCYYTDSYANEAKTMRQSFLEQQIKVNIVNFGSERDWMKNCLKRSAMLWDVYRANNKPVGLFDSDLICKQFPSLLFNDDFDVACEFRGVKFPAYRQYSAGIVLFNQTELGSKTLEYWKQLCEYDELKDVPLREQLYLKMAITKFVPKFLNLPNSYNAKPEQVNKDTVIVHNVASRRIKKEKA